MTKTTVGQAVGFLACAVGLFGLFAVVYGGERADPDLCVGLLLTSPILAFTGIEILRSK